MTFFISLFILLMQFLWRYIDEFVGKGLEWYVLVEIMFYASATLVSLALPLAILLSSLMTFGNLGENYELVAMKASGIPLKTIMRPLIVVSILISIFAFYFSNNILPIANLKFKSMLYDIRQKKLAFDLKDGMYYHGIEGYVIRVEKKDKDGSTIHDIMIYDHRDKRGNVKVTLAKDGIMKMSPENDAIVFSLFDGYNYEESINQGNYQKLRQFQRTKFKQQYKRFELADFGLVRTDEDLFKTNYQMLNINQLDVAIDSLKRKLEERISRNVEYAKKNYYYLQNIDSVNFVIDTINLAKGDSLGYPLFMTEISPKEKKAIITTALTKSRYVKKHYRDRESDYKAKRMVIRKHFLAWHEKITLSFACFVLFFIGAPLGAIIRKGGLGLPVVVSALFFIIFHILSITGKKYAMASVLSVTQGMWLASAILLPIGIFLTYKATSDSPIFDSEIWGRIGEKIKSRFKKNRT